MEKLKIELSKSILDIRLTDLGDDFWSTRTINIFRKILVYELCIKYFRNNRENTYG